MSSSRGRRQMAARPDPRRRSRTPLIAGMTIIALGLAIAAIAVALSLFSDATPTPTPSRVAGASATLPASLTAAPTTTPIGTSPAATSPAAGPTTAQPSPLSEAPMREVVFSALGLDNPLAPEASARRITFDVDGRGDISAEVSDISAGLVQLCLWSGDASTEPAATDCVVTPEDRIERTPTTAGPWTLLLAGAQEGRSPSVTLVLRFPATAAELQLANFRFQGQDSPNYTGFDVRLDALADGELTMASTWDDGLAGDYPYRLQVLDLSVEPEEPLVVDDIGHDAAASRQVASERTYQLTLTNLQESVVDAVFLGATIAWP